MAEIAADFEESEFRGPLFNQLLQGSPLLWEPGQVFEEYIGVDYAAHVNHPEFWSYRKDRFRQGLPLASAGLPYIRRKSGREKLLPDFRLNVFIQAKRSNEKSPVPKKVKDKGLSSPCCFFEVNSKQQLALDRLSSALKGDGLVCYAAPAFVSQADLYHHTEKRTVVQNSTFPSASRLRGHARWYYDRSGTFGVANPSYEYTRTGTIFEQVSDLVFSLDEETTSDASSNLLRLVGAIDESLQEEEGITARDTWFSYISQFRLDRIGLTESEVPEYFRAFVRIQAYCDAHGLEWLTVRYA